jgi:hypothetical protein
MDQAPAPPHTTYERGGYNLVYAIEFTNYLDNIVASMYSVSSLNSDIMLRVRTVQRKSR